MEAEFYSRRSSNQSTSIDDDEIVYSRPDSLIVERDSNSDNDNGEKKSILFYDV